MRLTAAARLSVNEDGTVTIVVKSFAATLDKKESAALLKSCGKPVENLLAAPRSTLTTLSPIPVLTVPTATPVQPVPVGPDRTESTGQEDQKIRGFVLNGATPNDMALSAILWALEGSPNSCLTHDQLRDEVYRLLEPVARPLDPVLMSAWNLKFWKSRPELAVTETVVRLA
jgi:hypothetical protein